MAYGVTVRFTADVELILTGPRNKEAAAKAAREYWLKNYEPDECMPVEGKYIKGTAEVREETIRNINNKTIDITTG